MSRNIEKFNLSPAEIKNEYYGFTWPGKVLLEPRRRDYVYLKGPVKGIVEFRRHDVSMKHFVSTVAIDGELHKAILRGSRLDIDKLYKRNSQLKKELLGYIDLDTNMVGTWETGAVSFTRWYQKLQETGLKLTEDDMKLIIKEVERRSCYYARIEHSGSAGYRWRNPDQGSAHYSQWAEVKPERV